MVDSRPNWTRLGPTTNIYLYLIVSKNAPVPIPFAHKNRPFYLVSFVFSIETTSCSPGNWPFIWSDIENKTCMLKRPFTAAKIHKPVFKDARRLFSDTGSYSSKREVLETKRLLASNSENVLPLGTEQGF